MRMCASVGKNDLRFGQLRKRSDHTDTLRSQSGSLIHSAFTATTESAYHARSDANALDTAGRQDAQQKGSNDSAALAALTKPEVILTHGRTHVQFIPWHNALKAFSCSLSMGTKVLSGTILLSDVLARQPDTHSIEFKMNQKVIEKSSNQLYIEESKKRINKNTRHENEKKFSVKETSEMLKPIRTIEPEGLHRVSADGRWEEIELAVDSEASESVVPPSMPESIQTVEGSASRRGVKYEVANGEQIPNEGEKKFNAATEEGITKQVTLQVCDVNQGLLSVSKVVKAGNRVVFDDGGNSFIENKKNGEKTWLKERNGMYIMKLWVHCPF